VIVEPNEAPIGRLDLETSRRTAKKRLCIPIELWDVEETDDTRRNPKDYNVLLQLANLWHLRLRHLNLNLFKKTAKIINDIPNLDVIKEKDFVYLAYNRSKAVKKPNLKAFLNPLKILDILKKDIFKVKPKPYNKRLVRLFIINRKSQFKWVIFLPNRQKPTIFNVIQGLFNNFKNRSYRYPNRFHFDSGNKINNLLQLDKVRIKFIQISKLLNIKRFTIFVKQFYKMSLIFRCKFRILILTLYLYSFINLLKMLIKSTKSISGF